MFLQDYNIQAQNVLTQKYLDECIPPEQPNNLLGNIGKSFKIPGLNGMPGSTVAPAFQK